MKVFLCLHHFLPDYVGGTEVYTFNLAKQLQLSGIEPVVVVPYFEHPEDREYCHEGIRVVQYAEASKEDRRMILGKKAPDGLAVFSSLLMKEKPDLVHFHELAPGRGFNLFHVEVVYGYKIPVILTFHLSYYTCMKGSLVFGDQTDCDGVIRPGRCTHCFYHSKSIKGLKAKLLYATAMALYKAGADSTELDSSAGTALGFPFVIDKLKKDLLKLATIADKIVVLAAWYKDVLVANGVPRQKLLNFQQAISFDTILLRKKERKISEPLKIVYLGRLSEQKGVHLLIDAVCSLPPEEITLSIYGPETDDAYIVENKLKTRHTTNIHWNGKLASSEVISTLSQHHVLCIPSEFEMNPLVIQEAFAAGLPVLASDTNGNKEQVKDGVNGWLFQSKNSMDLAAKLSVLIKDMDQVTAAGNNVPIPVDFKSIATQYIGVYTEALKREKKNIETVIPHNA